MNALLSNHIVLLDIDGIAFTMIGAIALSDYLHIYTIYHHARSCNVHRPTKQARHLLRKLRVFAAGDRLVVYSLNLKAGKSGAIPALCRNCKSQNADFRACFARLLVGSLRRTGKEIIC